MDKLTQKKLHIATPLGLKLMPLDWVYKSDKEKTLWLIGHGFDLELSDQPQVQIFLVEVA